VIAIAGARRDEIRDIFATPSKNPSRGLLMEFRRWCAGALMGLTWSGVLACSSGSSDELATFGGALGPSGGFGHGQSLSPTGFPSALAPRGAHLDYFGGRVVSNMQVVVVLYGRGSYIPEVTGSGGMGSMASFFGGVLASPYVDWLTEYDTAPQTPGTGQTIGRGIFLQQVAIVPSRRNNGTVIDDANIQAELGAQIQAGALPGPSHDALGNNNTYYAIFFPHGKTIRDQGSVSCSAFCAYHGSVARAANVGEIYYGVHPDMQSGSGCERGCGKAATVFGNYTQVASHEMVETITDPEVGLATTFAPPLAWYDRGLNQEISDLCAGQNGQVLGGDGVTYDVQTAFSNSRNSCVVTGPRAN
jgi:hypothetical protein